MRDARHLVLWRLALLLWRSQPPVGHVRLRPDPSLQVGKGGGPLGAAAWPEALWLLVLEILLAVELHLLLMCAACGLCVCGILLWLPTRLSSSSVCSPAPPLNTTFHHPAGTGCAAAARTRRAAALLTRPLRCGSSRLVVATLARQCRMPCGSAQRALACGRGALLPSCSSLFPPPTPLLPSAP